MVLKYLALKALQMEIVEFTNSVDPDGVAHKEPPHLDLCCLPSSSKPQYDITGTKLFSVLFLAFYHISWL